MNQRGDGYESGMSSYTINETSTMTEILNRNDKRTIRKYAMGHNSIPNEIAADKQKFALLYFALLCIASLCFGLFRLD